MVFGNIGRFELGQDGNFLDDIVNIILSIFDVNDLDGHCFSGAPIDTIFDQWCQLLKQGIIIESSPYPLKTLPQLPPPEVEKSKELATQFIPPHLGLKYHAYRCMFAWCKWTPDR